MWMPQVPSSKRSSMSKNSPSLHGFRLSFTDMAVIGLTMIAIFEMARRGLPFGWILICVVGHFFLFCNVFRVRRSYELMWAVAFLVNVAFWIVWQLSLEWLPPLLTQFPITMIVIGMEIRSPQYHGIFAEKWNPRLGECLASRTHAILP